MKTTTMNLMIATAALAVAACSASAQTLKAEIPMSFHASGKLMAAGTYELRQVSGSGPEIVRVYNTQTHSAVVLLASVKGDAPKAWQKDGTPKITFECLGDSCTLRRMWNGEGRDSYTFPAPKARPGDIEARQMTVVTLAMTRVH